MSREDEMKAQHLQYLEGRRPDFVSMIMNLNEYKNKGMTAKEYKEALNSMKKNYDMPDYFLGSVIDSGNAAYMESRKAKREGSLMIPREGYGVGSKVIKKIIDAAKAKIPSMDRVEEGQGINASEFEKLLSTPNEKAMFFSKKELKDLKKEIKDPDAYYEMLDEFAAVRRQDDEIIRKGKALGYTDEKINEVLRGGSKALEKIRTIYDRFEERAIQVAEEEAAKDRRAEGSLIGGQKKLDVNKDGKISGEDFSLLRDRKEKGGMPVDTYPNIPPEEMAEAMASQLPDDEMEEEYIKYVMDESLNDEEQDYLAEALTKDPKLSDIMDKVITTAGEFSGAGEVEGPGTGVSDSIPARLSDGEFVFTKKATDQIGADNLQRMMDDAERAYDGRVQQLNVGGMPRKDEEDLEGGKYDMSKTDEEIRKLMIGANKMPSVQ